MNNEEVKLLVTTEELQTKLSCGRRYAIKIGELSKAKVTIGARTFWNVDKLREFLYKESV